MMVKPLTDRKWRGYNFEQLQDQRILNDARIAIQKTVLEQRFKDLNPVGKTRETTRRIFNAFGLVDYIIMGTTIYRKLRPLLRLFRRNKK